MTSLPSALPLATVPLPPGGAEDVAALVSALRQDQRRHWRDGLRLKAEAYLARFAALRVAPDGAFLLIEGEILVREELGERPGLEEYLRRFPPWADRLQSFFAARQTVAVAAPTVAWETGGPSAPQAGEASVRIPGYEV